MARKTADVESIKAHVNKALNDPDVLANQDRYHGVKGAQSYREGIIAVFETILMDTGNYKGYSEPRDLADNTRRTYF
jgi:hypothetical protein